MTTLEHLDFRNITFQKAHDFARVFVDAFRDETIALSFQAPAERLDDPSLPHISEYEQLLQKARAFESRVQGLAEWFYLGTRENWRHQIFLMRELGGRPVAGALWVLPKYQPKPAAPSLWFRFKTLLLKGWYYLRSLTKNRRSLANRPIGRFFESTAREYFCADSPERTKRLEQMSVGELRATTYPGSSSYYLDLFFVRSGMQGKKYGKRIMDETLAYIRSVAVPPPNLPAGAPPKATLQAVPKARGFYKKYGYDVGATAERTGNNGEHLIVTYCFMNID